MSLFKRLFGVGFITGLLGTLVLFRRLIWSPEPMIWADDFDSQLIIWIAEWGHHALSHFTGISGLFEANSFFPHHHTLAYSDHLLSLQLFYTPLRSFGISYLNALYISLGIFCVVSCMLSDWALRSATTFGSIERAFIIICSHFSLPMTGFFYHYQLFGFELAPPALIFFLSFLTTGSLSGLIMTALVSSLAVGFSMYLAPILLLLLGGLTVFLLLFQICTTPKSVLKLIRPPVILIAALATLANYFIQFRPYIKLSNKAWLDPAGAMTFSADYDSLLTEGSIQSFWYSPGGYAQYGDWEHALFPGYTLLGGLLVAVVIIFVAFIVKKYNFNILFRQLAIAGTATTLLAWTLSLGPYSHDSERTALPFFYLTEISSIFSGLRAPGRFGAFIPFGISMLILVAVNQLEFLQPKFRNFLVAIMGIAIAVESIPNHGVFPVPLETKSEVYSKVGARTHPGESLLELPVSNGEHVDTIKRMVAQLQGSFAHWNKMVVGYGAKTTPELEELIDIDNNLKTGVYQIDRLDQFAKKLKFKNVLVHLDRYPAEMKEKFIAWLQSLGVVEDLGSGSVFVKMVGRRKNG